ncbi:NAD(+) diphosphatase [Vannielia sp.]|uniref:NAD(+) diphosphatase n=1 Tax=Vannielia sp. TaxID=2813045 RepID=UPI00260C09B4|nr:NAD(+) diphosphatase [Vannielia sp.]MDF1873366.1 NAD(+) diphosphatase [Vannielia sp.]
MRHAEQVTFGGGGLDRKAERRGDEAALDALAQAESTRHAVLWRGKVLIEGSRGAESIACQPVTADILQSDDLRVFLGVDPDGNAWFAHDVSGWQPETPPFEPGVFLDTLEQGLPGHPGLRFSELRNLMTALTPLEAEVAATARGIFGWHLSHGFCARCGAESDVSQAGWQRECPACRASHFPRTDPVAIMLITHGNSVLMGRSPGWPQGMYSLLAGFVEPGETIEAAVRREVFEESGVRVGPVGYLASQPWPFPASLMMGCYGEATTTEITVDPNELEDARWFTREEMLDIFAGRNEQVKPARRGAIAQFLIANWLADTLD